MSEHMFMPVVLPDDFKVASLKPFGLGDYYQFQTPQHTIWYFDTYQSNALLDHLLSITVEKFQLSNSAVSFLAGFFNYEPERTWYVVDRAVVLGRLRSLTLQSADDLNAKLVLYQNGNLSARNVKDIETYLHKESLILNDVYSNMCQQISTLEE